MPIGAFELNNGVWVPVDVWESVGGQPLPVMDGHVLDAGEWKLAYQREQATTMTLTSAALPDVVAGATATPPDIHPAITGTVLDTRGEAARGNVDVYFVLDGVATKVATVPLVDGQFSYNPQDVYPTTGAGLYRMDFPTQLPYLASQAETNTFAIKAGQTQIAITSQPSGDILAGTTPLGTYAGTVRRTSDSAPAAGTIKLQLVNDDNSLTLLSDSVTVAADGSWSYSHGTAGVLGPRRLLVEFTPSGSGFEASTQSGGTVNVVLGTPVLTKGSVSNTSFAASWTAVPGRTTTEAWVNGTLNLTNVGTSQTWQAGQYTEYALKVRAVGSTPGGAKVYSPFSTEYRCRTGRTEVRDTGAHQCYIHAIGSNSYRRDVGWNYAGDKVRQGFYSTAYGGAGYFGLIDYGDRGIYNRLVQDLGQARADNCWVTNFYVGLHRESGVGAFNSDVYAEISASDSGIGGGDPVGQWEPRGFTARPVSAGFIWYGFDARFGEEFKTYKHRSVCIRYHAKANYLGFNGVSAGSADCDAQIRVEWNFVTVSGATGVWLN